MNASHLRSLDDADSAASRDAVPPIGWRYILSHDAAYAAGMSGCRFLVQLSSLGDHIAKCCVIGTGRARRGDGDGRRRTRIGGSLRWIWPIALEKAAGG